MDWSAVLGSSMTDLLSQVTTAVPQIIPTVLAITGIGVAWKVIKRFVKSA